MYGLYETSFPEASSAPPQRCASGGNDDRKGAFERKGTSIRRRCVLALVATFAIYGLIAAFADLFSLFCLAPQEQVQEQKVEPLHDKFDGQIQEVPAASSGRGSSERAKRVGFGLLGRGTTGNGTAVTTASSLTDRFANVANVADPYDASSQQPFFWSVGVPTPMVANFLKCYPLVQASWMWINGENPYELRVHATEQPSLGKAVDVDMGTMLGVKRAKDLKLVESGIADFIASPYLLEILNLFTPQRRGRIFTIMTMPSVRVAQSYGYLKSKGLYDGDQMEFVTSDHILADNYMTRVLSGKWDVTMGLSDADVAVAIDIIREKFVVALSRDAKDLVERVVSLFGWGSDNTNNSIDCMFPPAVMQTAANPHEQLTDLQMEIRKITKKRNEWDYKLFYAVERLSSEARGSIPATAHQQHK